jgi:hypothetical protein
MDAGTADDAFSAGVLSGSSCFTSGVTGAAGRGSSEGCSITAGGWKAPESGPLVVAQPDKSSNSSNMTNILIRFYLLILSLLSF